LSRALGSSLARLGRARGLRSRIMGCRACVDRGGERIVGSGAALVDSRAGVVD